MTGFPIASRRFQSEGICRRSIPTSIRKLTTLVATKQTWTLMQRLSRTGGFQAARICIVRGNVKSYQQDTTNVNTSKCLERKQKGFRCRTHHSHTKKPLGKDAVCRRKLSSLYKTPSYAVFPSVAILKSVPPFRYSNQETPR